MELIFWMVIFGVATLAKQGAENISAIRKGKEPPEITKFNARQANGGVTDKLAAAVERRNKNGKEPGATRKVFRAWKANVAAESVEKMQHRHNRRVAWYRAHGRSVEDEKWHMVQQRKLRKQQQKLENWKVKKGLAPRRVEGQIAEDKQQAQPVPENVVGLDEARAKRGEDQGTEQPKNGPAPAPRETIGDVQKKHPLYCAASPSRKHADDPKNPTVCRWCKQHYRARTTADDDKAKKKAASKDTTQAQNTGGTNMYNDAVTELRRQAADIDSYGDDLNQLAEGCGYGNEVTGPLHDMVTELNAAAGKMCDLATQISGQGGNVRNAYEKAPWAPDKDKLIKA